MTNLIAAAIFICLAIASAILFVIYPGQLFVWYLLVKPVVDGFLEQGATFGGVTLSFSYLPSLVIPSLFLGLAFFHAQRFRYLSFKGFVIFYVLLNVFAYFKEGNFSVGTTGYYIRVIFPIFLYFGVPLFVESRAALEKLVKIAAFAGIFPCAMIFLQKLGFISYNRDAERLGSVIYDRATGGYADSFSVALPIIIAIFFLLHIIQSNKENGKIQKIYELLLGGYLFSLIFTFHRMTFIVVSVVLCLWIYLNRRYSYAVYLGVGAVIAISTLQVFLLDIFGDVDLLAERDAGVVTTNSGSEFALERTALHGRGWLWTLFIREYLNAPFLDQMFGIRLPGRAPHNDYIRVIFTVGAFGFAVYMFMLFLIGIKLWSIMTYYSRSDDVFFKNLSQVGVFMFIFYILGGVTLTISTLSTMSWYFWILFGIISYQYNKARDAGRKEARQPLLAG